MVVQSPAIAVARHTLARPPPPGPAAQPLTLPPSSSSRRVEPRPPPPRLVPSGLDTRSPHPCQESHKPPRRPPLPLPPTETMTPTTGAASTPRWNRRRKTTGHGPPSPRHCRLHHPQRGGGGGAQNTAPCHSRDHADALSGTSAQSSLVVVIVGGGSSGRKRGWWWLPGAEAAAEEAAARC